MQRAKGAIVLILIAMLGLSSDVFAGGVEDRLDQLELRIFRLEKEIAELKGSLKASPTAEGVIRGGESDISARLDSLRQHFLRGDYDMALSELDALRNFILLAKLRATPEVAPREEEVSASSDNAVKINRLILGLRSEKPLIRQHSAKALGEIEDRRVVPPLIEALNDEDETVRWIAAKALGDLGDTSAIAPLIKTLRDPHDTVRQVAMASLEKLGGEEKGYLTSPGSVRSQEGPILGKIRGPGERDISSAPTERAIVSSAPKKKAGFSRALERLSEIDKTTLQIPEGGVPTQEIASTMTPEMPEDKSKLKQEPPVQSLIESLEDEDAFVRQVAAKTLGDLGDKRAVEPLIQALKDEEPSVRESAADALKKLGDLRAIGPLMEATRDKDEKVKKAAVEALRKLSFRRSM